MNPTDRKPPAVRATAPGVRHPPGGWGVLAVVLGLAAGAGRPAPAQTPAAAASCLHLEAYIRADSAQCQQARQYLADFERSHPGVRVDLYDVARDREALGRLRALAAQFGLGPAQVPTFHALGRVAIGFRDAETTGPQIEELLTVHAFLRAGCPRCEGAKPFLYSLNQWYPGLRVAVHEVTTDPNAVAWMEQLARWFGIQAASTPAFYVGGRFLVGYDGDQITGAQILGLIQAGLVPCRPPAPAPAPPAAAPAAPPPGTNPGASARPATRSGRGALALAVVLLQPGAETTAARGPTPPAPPLGPVVGSPAPIAAPAPATTGAPPEAGDLPPDAPLPAEAPLPPEAPLPGPTPGPGGPLPGGVFAPRTAAPEEAVRVPVLGRLNVKALGLPAFTFLIGLVDGFNPCAMWVLVFLLSVLVGLNDRRKVLAVAGTFVLISGLAYFAFMAAWLNVFLLIGYARAAQVALGALAVLVGAVHVKDFFAFKKGISFSIPESAKPGIYARVRRIALAKNLAAALAGAIVLAVLVNTVELLCTAGLPAVYTQILTYQGLPAWEYYLYLALYNVAYMLDDTIVLTAVVVTMSRRRLQEKEGRWLKLVSGLVILALGALMLVKPEWLY